MKVLQEKYKDDKQRLQQETMKFYQEHKVNPFASCLPLVAQLPVFLSLFYMLRHDLRHRHLPGHQPARDERTRCRAADDPGVAVLFIPDITDKATGAVLVVLLVLYVGSQLRLDAADDAATADKNQRIIMLACRSSSSASSSASRRA